MIEGEDLTTAFGACGARGGAVTFHRRGAPARTLPAAELVEEARRAAATLVGSGVRPGDTVGVLGPNHPEWAVWALATWFAGGVLVPIGFPVGRDHAVVAAHARRLATRARCRLVLAPPAFADPSSTPPVVAWDRPPGAPAPLPPPPGGTEAAVVQYTSGTTSDPKGVELSHGAILAFLRALDIVQTEPDTIVRVSWLPLFHDWGLFGCLLSPLLSGHVGHVMTVDDYVADPVGWLRTAVAVGATTIPGPPTTWPQLLAALAADHEGIDLSGISRCVLGAELVDPTLLDRIREEAPRYGLRPDALDVAYGLAESVLTITLTPLGGPVRIDEVDADELGRAGRAVPGPGKRIVSCGSPIPGVSVRVSAGGRRVPDRVVGEIEVRSPSLLTRYRGDRRPVLDRDGWFATGDLGYLDAGELFVTGRAKDLVVVHGHNIAPQDLEWAAEGAAGVRRGRTVAVPSDAEGDVTIVVEPRRGAEPGAVIAGVRAEVLRQVGLTPGEVVVVERGAVGRTTSGKLTRAATRRALSDRLLPVVARG